MRNVAFNFIFGNDRRNQNLFRVIISDISHFLTLFYRWNMVEGIFFFSLGDPYFIFFSLRQMAVFLKSRKKKYNER